ncbi:MAG: S8 family serine peptidase [Desulfuromonadales bacterium]|nr:S8 family serine peptidase [Desulfuromonadales bacterium]
MNYICLRIILSVFVGLFLLPFPTTSATAASIDTMLQNKLVFADPDEMIPIIVRMKDSVAVQALAVPTRKKGYLRAQGRANLVHTLKSRAKHSQQSLKSLLDYHGVSRYKDLWLINGTAFLAKPALIEEISRLPEVESLVLDQVVEIPEVVMSQASGPAEPNIDQVKAPSLWALGYAGQGTTVAIVDSGVDVNHADLGERWRSGTNSWYDPNGEHPAVPTDLNGHGTQVAGLVLGGNNDGTYIGVAPDAEWIGVKIFADNGLASNSAIHAGFQWLLDPDDNPNTDDAPDIVNNSWAFETSTDVCNTLSREFQADIQVLKAAGIAVVFAAGNTGPSTSSSVAPANYPESFAVGSVGTFLSTTLISDFSARGPSACDGTIYPEVVAPGFLVWTSDLTAGGAFPFSYAQVSGTSFSTSHVSGVMALLLSAFPGVSVDAIETALKQSATDLGAVGADNVYGFGLIDSLAAFNYLSGQQDISVTDSISPETDGLIAFGEIPPQTIASATVSVRNSGSLPLLLGVVDDSSVAAPFSVTSDSCSGMRLDAGESCSIGVNFAPTAEGSFAGSLAVLSNVIERERVTLDLTGIGSLEGRKAISVTDSISPETDGMVIFSQITPGATDSASIWVQNVGDSLLTLGEVDTNLVKPPFSVISDACSGRVLLTAEVCTVDVRFAPTLPGNFTGSLDILSDATGDERATVFLSGTGNTPPMPPQSLAPVNGATVGDSVTFSWLPASDADGDTVAQFLVYSPNADFSSATTREVETVQAVALSACCLLLGTLIPGLTRRRRNLALVLVFSGLLLTIAACGGGGGGDDSPVDDGGVVLPAEAQSITVNGLISGTTYYWKIVARDSRGAETQSEVRTVLVQ